MSQKSRLGLVLSCILSFLFIGSTAVQPGDTKGQDFPQPDKKPIETIPAPKKIDKEEPQKIPPKDMEKKAEKSPQSIQINADAKMTVHRVKMDQGAMYRITVKTEGFVPELSIEGNKSTPLINAGNFDPLGIQPPVKEKTVQIAFIPPSSKEYVIKVGHFPNADVGQGLLPYVLTIERAAFKPVLTVKENKLDVSEQTRKMEQGKAYSITVTGKGFAPEVQIMDGSKSVGIFTAGRWFGFGPDSEFVNTFTFVPTRTTDFRFVMLVGPTVQERQVPLTYTMQVAELKPLLSTNEKLTALEPAYARRGGVHKVHLVNLEAGKKYQIDMASTNFDTYLFLEDAGQNYITEDDDGGGNLNARIVFQPTKSGAYRVVATTFDRLIPTQDPGPYTLTVIENPDAQQLLAPPPFDLKK